MPDLTLETAASKLQEAADNLEQVADSGLLSDPFDQRTVENTSRVIAYLRDRLDRKVTA